MQNSLFSPDDDVKLEVEDLEVSDERAQEISKINTELCQKYPEKYKFYREQLLAEIQPDIDAYCQKLTTEYCEKIERLYANKLKTAKEELIRTYEQEFEDEVEKAMAKEMLYATRRKEVDCNKEYQKLKREVTQAKKEKKQVRQKSFVRFEFPS